MKCTKCKLQYVDKSETELNLRISNHRKDVLKLNAISADWHFAQSDHGFNTDTKFIITEKLQNTKLSKESITESLKKREKIWVKKPETPRPKRLNHELNWQISSYAFFPFNLISPLNAYQYHKSVEQNIARGKSRTPAMSEMGLFVIIVYSFNPLTIFIEKSIIWSPGSAFDNVKFINDAK